MADIIDHSPHHPEPSPKVPTANNLIMIDNYDSFTWNIYQYLMLEGATVTVVRNDKITLEELIAKKPTQLIVSPGPGHPTTDSGISRDALKYFAGKIPIFGVCMGQQCIIDVYGGEVSSAGEWLHGKTSPLSHDGKGVYQTMPQKFPVTRYHSLAGTHATLPACLKVSSWIANPDGSKGIIQGVRHKTYTVEGVQFHPESILTAGGRTIFRNFLRLQGGTWEESRLLEAETAARKPVVVAPHVKPQGNILAKIYAARKEAVAAQKVIPGQRLSDLQATYDLNGAPPVVPLLRRLQTSPFDISLMAEVKRASPSKGIFDLDISAPQQAHKYALAGASVISVLTEPQWFKGSIDDLRAVRQVLDGMPNRPCILRKEFIFEEYQILEARLAGADTVLLIVKMLNNASLLKRLYDYSVSLGMEPLIEVQNTEEMTVAVELGAKVIGVNNRNLESFEVDIGTAGRLRTMVGKETVLCALSGITSYDDIKQCKTDGIDAILVGEALMRAPDATKFISQLCAGKDAIVETARPAPLLTKICGTRTVEMALEAVKSGADFIGICLVPGAKRCISVETATAISKAVHETAGPVDFPSDTSAKKGEDFFSMFEKRLNPRKPRVVGIFQNQSLEEIISLAARIGLDMVQLHGEEPLEWSRQIPVPVIRCFKPGNVSIGVRGFHTVPLLDSGAGTGKLLDAEAVKKTLGKDPNLRVMLAGGLNPDNVAEAVKAVGEFADRIIGVDVSSGVEEDGKQSLVKITAFIKNAKSFR